MNKQQFRKTWGIGDSISWIGMVSLIAFVIFQL